MANELELISVEVVGDWREEVWEGKYSRQTHYHPILTEEERGKRLKRINDAACALLTATWRRQAQKGSEDVL